MNQVGNHIPFLFDGWSVNFALLAKRQSLSSEMSTWEICLLYLRWLVGGGICGKEEVTSMIWLVVGEVAYESVGFSLLDITGVTS